MSEFLLLYRGGQRPTSPEEFQQVLQKWMAWFKDLAAKGHIVDRGQPLERSGELYHRKHGTARDRFLSSLTLARNPAGRRFLKQRVSACERIE